MFKASKNFGHQDGIHLPQLDWMQTFAAKLIIVDSLYSQQKEMNHALQAPVPFGWS